MGSTVIVLPMSFLSQVLLLHVKKNNIMNNCFIEIDFIKYQPFHSEFIEELSKPFESSFVKLRMTNVANYKKSTIDLVTLLSRYIRRWPKPFVNTNSILG